MSAASELSPPRDLSHHFNRTSNNRKPSEIKKFYKFFQIPGIGNVAGGLPNANLFPFDTLEAQVAKPQRWQPTPNHPNEAPPKIPSEADAAASHINIPKTDAEVDPSKKIDVATALQYGTAAGFPPIRSFIRQFTRENLHPNVPYLGGPEVILTCGSTDGLFKTAELIVEPWFADKDPVEERPSMLCETFVYMNAPNTVVPKGVQVAPVEIDSEGMLAHGKGSLQDVLENWDPKNGRRPHFMYTVTMGHNPTSGVLSVQRRKDIYALACKYDILIVEDDPYWYLQYPSAVSKEAESRNLEAPLETEFNKPAKSSGYEFLDSLVPSFLSLDTEGRVIRLDTFSKTVAPGCRLGWITAQPKFIERLLDITEATTQQPSGFVQAMVAQVIMGNQPEAVKSRFLSLSSRDKLSFTGWSTSGWVRWLAGLRGVYERRMNKMCAILDTASYQLKQSTPTSNLETDWGVITKTRILSFDWPRGGMFVWLRLHFETHPLWQARGHSVPLLDGPALSTALFMFLTHKPHLVLLAPGTMFAASEGVMADQAWRFFRLCFAAEDEDEIEPSSRRLANGIQRFWRVKSVSEIERYIKEFETTDVQTMEGVDRIGYGMGC